MSDTIAVGPVINGFDQQNCAGRSLRFADFRSNQFYIRLRRVIDLVVCIIAMPAIVSLVAALAVLVLLLMGRPVLFAQDRVGRHGRIFRMYKLRTMRNCVDGTLRQTATSLGDCRITPLGAFLRRCHLDELPQLWNIVKGDMSLIGPRPEQPNLVSKYERELPDYNLRHTIAPGLTGLAQVSFGYAANLAETRIKLGYDLDYVRNFSPMLDLKVLFLTVRVFMDRRYVR